MGIKSLVAAVTASAAATALLALPAQAAPDLPPVEITQCGQSIDRDAYLSRDLTCSSGFGILVQQLDPDGQVPNVKIDLRHHTLRGSGSGVGSPSDHIAVAGFGYPGPGVSIDIENGRVERWGIGVTSQGGLTVSHLRVSDNQIGLNCTCAGLVTRSVITDNRVGTTSFEGGFRLRDNVLSRNDVASEVDTASPADYVHNAYDKNRIGVLVNPGAGPVRLRRNTFTRNTTGVIAVPGDIADYYGQAVLEENTFTANRDGVYLPEKEPKDSNHQLRSNVAVGNKRYGIFAPGSEDLGGNVATGNGEACVGVVCRRPGR